MVPLPKASVAQEAEVTPQGAKTRPHWLQGWSLGAQAGWESRTKLGRSGGRRVGGDTRR